MPNRSVRPARRLCALAPVLAPAIFLTAMAGNAPAQPRKPAQAPADGPGYRIVDRIPIPDGWWDHARVDAANRMLFVALGKTACCGSIWKAA